MCGEITYLKDGIDQKISLSETPPLGVELGPSAGNGPAFASPLDQGGITRGEIHWVSLPADSQN